jgi:hypothetical protein
MYLPTEIWYYIFSFLYEYEQIICRFVCLEWNNIILTSLTTGKILNIDLVAAYGNTKIILWASENGCKIGCEFINNAARYGRIDILYFLYYNLRVQLYSTTCDQSIIGGQIEAIKWLWVHECGVNLRLLKEYSKIYPKLTEWPVKYFSIARGKKISCSHEYGYKVRVNKLSLDIFIIGVNTMGRYEASSHIMLLNVRNPEISMGCLCDCCDNDVIFKSTVRSGSRHTYYLSCKCKYTLSIYSAYPYNYRLPPRTGYHIECNNDKHFITNLDFID